MHSPGFLENWHPTLSRADLLRGGGNGADSLAKRVAMAAALISAPVVAVSIVCAAFQLLTKLV